MIHKRKNHTGFTLIELLISMSILGLIAIFSFSVYLNFFDSLKNIKASNLVYEEARFLMERIAKEVRNGTVDYEEYYNQSALRQSFPDSYSYLRNETYGQDYCQYSRQFFLLGKDGEIGTLDDEVTGQRATVDPVDGLTPIPPAIGYLNGLGASFPSPIQEDLFLVDISGQQRVYLKRIKKTDSNGNTIGKIGLLKMEGKDYGIDHLNAFDPMLDGSSPGPTCRPDIGENDGRIDTWLCAPGFPCQNEPLSNAELCQGITHKVIYDPSTPEDNSFVDITPEGLDVISLQFIVSPMDDPRKAYATPEVQIQPHVSIRINARASTSLARKFRSGVNPSIDLESMISARAYSEILSECNLKQCTPSVSPDRNCPLTTGVCGPLVPGNTPAQQSCTDYIWPGCSENTYRNYADNEYGLDTEAVFLPGGRSFFEGGSEYKSCDNDLTACLDLCGGNGTCISSCQNQAESCKSRRCSDGYDNDCSGAADQQDSACNLFLCSDGVYNPGVEAVNGCIDVGGLCSSLRPLQTTEASCSDGYDNDCDGFADQFDADCVALICKNGNNDPNGATTLYTPSPIELFLKADYASPHYLLEAQPADEDGGSLSECSGQSSLSADIGGLCGLCLDQATGKGSCECGSPGCTSSKILPGRDLTATESGQACYDNLDNDCDGQADELDSDCQAVICQDTQKNCNLAPTGYLPASFLGGYDDASCSAPPLNGNDEACTDVGGICDGYTDGNGFNHTFVETGETTLAQCQDGLDNDCDGGKDWADKNGSCCAFTPYCLSEEGSSFEDGLESSDYVGGMSQKIDHNLLAGQITLNDPTATNETVSSNTLPLDVSVCTNYKVSLTGTLATTSGTSDIRFQVSGGNGKWCGDDDCSGDTFLLGELANDTPLDGKNLQWRAILSGDGVNSPVLDSVKLTVSNCS